MAKPKFPIPETLQECFDSIRQRFPEEELQKLKEYKEEDLILLHLANWGLYVRNHFIHPEDSPIRRKFESISRMLHRDTMSSIFTKLFWMQLNGKEITVDDVMRLIPEYAFVLKEDVAEAKQAARNTIKDLLKPSD